MECEGDGEDAAALRRQCELLQAQLKATRDEREDLKHIVTKLTNQIETLTEEMFGEANERVATAERARYDAEQERAEAEKARMAAEEDMREVRDRIGKLKRAIETKQGEQAGKEPASRRDTAADLIDRLRPSLANAAAATIVLPQRELDSVVEQEFRELVATGAPMSKLLRTAYFQRCMREDIMPCLVSNHMVRHVDDLLALLAANRLVAEALPAPEEGMCSLSGEIGPLTHRIRAAVPPSPTWAEWQTISPASYRRIVAVGDLYTYLRYFARGLVKTTENEVFGEITKCRLRIVCARLGWASA